MASFHIILVVAMIITMTLSVPVPLFSPMVPSSKVSLGPDVDLEYTIDITQNSATFNLTIYDSVVFGTTDQRAWIAFGFTESSTSGYLGADLMTVQFMAHAVDECRIADSYVPFAAYPLDHALPGVHHSFVMEDKCQNDISWELISCKRTTGTRTVSISVRRPLHDFDSQDRILGPGVQHAVYSYANGVGAMNFFDGTHGGRHFTLYDSNGTVPSEPSAKRNLPDDVWGNRTISAFNHTVDSHYKSSYACTSLEADVPISTGSASLIAFEPVLKSKSGPLAVGSMVLYACPKFSGFKYLRSTQSCGSRPGQFPNPSSFCTDVLFSWGNGMDSFVLPNDVSFVVDDSNKYLVLETMYHNPNLESNMVDESGVLIHYSRDLRKHAAGTLLLGDSLGTRTGELVSNAEVSSTCNTACTENFDQKLHIFAASPRMHYTGRSIATFKYDASGEFIETVSRVDFWSATDQATQLLERQITLSPGEQLSTTCKYDTRKLPNTKFGFEMEEEVCIEYAFYYPRQKQLGNIVGLPVLPAGGSLTYCGVSAAGDNNGTLCGYKVLPNKNLPLRTSDMYEYTFGTDPDLCPNGMPRLVPGVTPRNAAQPACFPADARVRLRDGRVLRMHQLKVGDEVAVRNGVYSEVFGFTHRERFGKHDFVSIRVGDRAIEASSGHMVYANGQLVEAALVQVGDIMIDAHGNKRRVRAVRNKQKVGLYNPQTLDGNIIVNGIVVSTYTKAVQSNAAHAMLTIFRSVSHMFGSNILLALKLEGGADSVRVMTGSWAGLSEIWE